jgi:hypothetical protein
MFIIGAFVPIICSCVIGFFFFQEGIFNHALPAFQYFWTAVVGAIFYNLLRTFRTRDAYLGLLILLFLTFATTQSTRFAFILRDIIYVAAIAATMIVYVRYFLPLAQSHPAHPAVILAGLYGLLYILGAEGQFAILRILGHENEGYAVVSVATTVGFFGLTIGFALGAGFSITERILQKK